MVSETRYRYRDIEATITIRLSRAEPPPVLKPGGVITSSVQHFVEFSIGDVQMTSTKPTELEAMQWFRGSVDNILEQLRRLIETGGGVLERYVDAERRYTTNATRAATAAKIQWPKSGDDDIVGKPEDL